MSASVGSSNVDFDQINKINMELLMCGYLRLRVLPLCGQHNDSGVPRKVFNILLSSMICNDVEQCLVLSAALSVLQDYHQWVNIDKKSKQSFMCTVDTSSSPSVLLQSYFDHVCNLHGLTYADYDALHQHCHQTKGMECVTDNCLILSESQKSELQKLKLQLGVHTNPLQKTQSDQSVVMELEDEWSREETDLYPETSLTAPSHTVVSSTVTSLLTPNWGPHHKQKSLRSKWQKHVAAASSTDFVSQLSVLSLLPSLSTVSDDVEASVDADALKVAVNMEAEAEQKNASDIILPSSPTSMTVSVKSYRMIFEHINAAVGGSHVSGASYSFRQISQMELNPFMLLPDDEEEEEDANENEITQLQKADHKKEHRFEYEFQSKLSGVLNEMDLMDDGALDMVGLGTALSDAVKDDSFDCMECAGVIFEDEALAKDDMENAKIADIVLYILESDQAEVVELKQLICSGLKIEVDGNDDNDGGGGDGGGQANEQKMDELMQLELKEKEHTDEPYKPVYQVSSGIQRFGTAEKKPVKTKPKEKDTAPADNETSLTITTSFSDDEVTRIMDKIHVYLFHAVYEEKQIPL